MSDVDVLESVIAKDQALLDAVRPEQLTAPTPCPDYDVQALVNHICGWVRVFAAAANERSYDEDPSAFTTTDPGADFRQSATELVTGWRAGGMDRELALSGPPQPAEVVLSMTLMEYLTHGCDLAMAIGADVPFSDHELTVTLERASNTLPAQYRGEGMPFGNILDTPPTAPVLTRFLAFMGRPAPTH